MLTTILVVLIFSWTASAQAQDQLITNCYNVATAKSRPIKPRFRIYMCPPEPERYGWVWTVKSDTYKPDLDSKKGRGCFKPTPYVLEPGFYYVEFEQTVTEKTYQCYLSVIVESPKAYISRGSRVLVPPKRVKFDARHSYDVSNEEYDFLTYLWTCTQSNNDNPVCDSLPTDASDDSYLNLDLSSQDNVTIALNLKVSSKFKLSDTAKQIVQVRVDAPHVYLKCTKNCFPTVSAQETGFVAKCRQNCDSLIQSYRWRIIKLSDSTDIKTNSSNSSVFLIDENVFQEGKYRIICAFSFNYENGQIAETVEYVLTPAEPSPITKCETVPQSGESRTTDFKFSCEGGNSEPNNFYEVTFAGKLVAGGFVEAFDWPFKVEHGQGHGVVRIWNQQGVQSEQILTVTLTDPYNATDMMNDEELIELGQKLEMSSLARELEMNDQDIFYMAVDDVSTIIQRVVIRYMSEDMKGPLSELKERLMWHIKDTGSYVKQFGYLADCIVKRLKENALKPSKPVVSRLTGFFCETAGRVHYSRLFLERLTSNYYQRSYTYAKALTECVEQNNIPEYTFSKHRRLDLTTLASTVDDAAVTENYDDYMFYEEEYYWILEQLNEGTKSRFEAAVVNAGILVAAIPVGHGTHGVPTIKTNFTTVEVFKDLGANFHIVYREARRNSIVPSSDLQKIDYAVELLMTTWHQTEATANFMWWNKARVVPITDIVSLEFRDSERKQNITAFDDPMSISLKINGNLNNMILNEGFKISGNFTSLAGSELNPYIHIWRVTLDRNHGLRVMFYNVTKEFDVVITKFRFPTIEDFESGDDVRTVRPAQDNLMLFNNDENYSIWGYVAILPNLEKFVDNETDYPYNVAFYATSCMKWNITMAEWRPACRPGRLSTEGIISCECKYLSVISGYLNNLTALSQSVDTIELELSFTHCFAIFAFVCVVFGIYCIVLLCAERKKRTYFYYLADNNAKDTYYYLVMVKTSSWYDSGTTSQITMRLTGTKFTTKPHVLNYPDPEMRLFCRKGQDIFVLATPQPMGNVTQIELWFNANGASASWRCKVISIFDLETHKKWYFNVQTEFCLLRNVHRATIDSTEKKKESRLTRFLKYTNLCHPHHTWRLSNREENFSYIKRATMILSNITLTGTFIIHFHEPPNFQQSDCLDKFSRYTFDGYLTMISIGSSLIAFTIHITIALFFRASKIQYSHYKQYARLPFVFTVFCWMILCGLILSSMTHLLLLGFWMPKNSSLICLTSILIGVVIEVLVFQNIFLLIRKPPKVRKVQEIDKAEIFDMIETQRAVLTSRYGDPIMRPHFQQFYKPLDGRTIRTKRAKEKERNRICLEILDLVIFTCYTVVLFVLVITSRSTIVLQSKKNIEAMMQGIHTDSPGFEEVESVADMYTYINETLIPVMQSSGWYGRYVSNNAGMMKDFTNKYLGVARLRQHRMRPNTCNVVKQMAFLNLTCTLEFASNYEETRTFGFGWSNSSRYYSFDDKKSMWSFSTAKQTETYSVAGKFGSYSGGGYLAYLGRKFYNSVVNFIVVLSKRYWIDHKSRCIFIEFLTYNVNFNIFNAVSLVYEQSATGFISKTIQVEVGQLLFVSNENEMSMLGWFICFLIFAALLVLKLIFFAIRNPWLFYKSFGFWIDIFIIAQSIGFIAMTLVQNNLVNKYVGRLQRENRNVFIPYFDLFLYQQYLNISTGFLLCMAIIRLWKYWRFGKIFRVMERTLVLAARGLLGVTLAFLVIILGFGFAGILMLGDEFPDFAFLMDTSRTLVTMALKPDQFDIRDFLVNSLTYAYFTVYLLLMQIILLLYITVIVMAYTTAQLEFSDDDEDEFTIQQYFMEKYHYFAGTLGSRMVRLRSGAEPKHMLQPKTDEFRYANCVVTQTRTLESITLITKSVVRNIRKKAETAAPGRSDTGQLSDTDCRLMNAICRQMVFKKEEQDTCELFYKGHFVGETVRLIDEKRIVQMEKLVSYLLRDRTDTGIKKSKSPEELKVERCVEMTYKNRKTLAKCDLNLKLVCSRIEKMNIRMKKKTLLNRVPV